MKNLESRVSGLERQAGATEPPVTFARCEREPCEANGGYCPRCQLPCFTLDLQAAGITLRDPLDGAPRLMP